MVEGRVESRNSSIKVVNLVVGVKKAPHLAGRNMKYGVA